MVGDFQTEYAYALPSPAHPAMLSSTDPLNRDGYTQVDDFPAEGTFLAVVAVVDGMVVGFGSLSPYKDRAAYRTTVENSVYVSRHHARLGIGSALMRHLITLARDSGFHSIVARIEAGSEPSRALHRATGFELVGIEREVGRKFGRWLDVAVMQLLITD